jgi:protein CMS1
MWLGLCNPLCLTTLTNFSRVIRKFHTKDAKVAKLFGKHIKLNDAIKFLQSTRTGVAVGTATRLKDLVDEGMDSNLY